jgi:hypothetical protein
LRHLRVWHSWHRLHHWLLHHRLLRHLLHHGLHHWLLRHHHPWLWLHHGLHHRLHHRSRHHHLRHHSLSHSNSQKVRLLLIHHSWLSIIHILCLVPIPQLALKWFKYHLYVNLPCPYILIYDGIPLLNVFLHIHVIELYGALTDCVRAKGVLI